MAFLAVFDQDRADALLEEFDLLPRWRFRSAGKRQAKACQQKKGPRREQW